MEITAMKEYQFILKFAFDQPETDPSDCVAALEAGGCDDAVFGIGKLGRIALDFDREASSAEEAILSAIHDVKSVIPDIRLVEAFS
jgi:hypothetical protein